MGSELANPSTLTPLALIGLVIVQVVQLFRGHMDAKASREARQDDSLATILQKVLDQHAAAWGGLAGTLSEIQAHMRDTNAALSSFTHRLEQVERQLGTTYQGPAPRPAPARARPTREA